MFRFATFACVLLLLMGCSVKYISNEFTSSFESDITTDSDIVKEVFWRQVDGDDIELRVVVERDSSLKHIDELLASIYRSLDKTSFDVFLQEYYDQLDGLNMNKFELHIVIEKNSEGVFIREYAPNPEGEFDFTGLY